MKIKIAVPENPIFRNLYERCFESEFKHDVELIKLDESEISKFMLNNRCDLALMNPFSYASAVSKADYRIISGPALSTIGFTGLASIFFRGGLHSVKSCASSTPNDFIIMIAKILLNENYNFNIKLEKAEGIASDLLDNFDCVIQWSKSNKSDISLDISEEWYLHSSEMLPLAFWVCMEGEHDDDVRLLIEDLASHDLMSEEEVFEDEDADRDDETNRNGILFWRWNDGFESALEQVIQILYYHGYVSEISDIKLLGRENYDKETIGGIDLQ